MSSTQSLQKLDVICIKQIVHFFFPRRGIEIDLKLVPKPNPDLEQKVVIGLIS